MWTLFFIFVALLVGWATPQPEWAKKLTDSIVTKVQEMRNKKETNDFTGE